MTLQRSSRFAKPFQRILAKSDLRTVLLVPFVLQIVGTVGLVGYLSFRNGQQAVNDLAMQLMEQVSERVDQHLDSYLSVPTKINQINLEAVEAKLLDIRDLKAAGRLFYKQIQTFDVSYISYGLENGEFAGAGLIDETTKEIEISETSAQTKGINYNYLADANGNRTSLKYTDDYDHKSEVWYTETIAARQPIWSSIYVWDSFSKALTIAENFPIYDDRKQIIGVMSVDLLLSSISDFLRKLNVSPRGKVFIVEGDGLLVASSSTEKPFKQIQDEEPQRLSATESTDPMIRATATFLQQQFQSFQSINDRQQLIHTFDRNRYFVQVAPWKIASGIDWWVVITVPEADFMAQIDQNNRLTILLSLAALVSSLGIGVLTARWITQPILHLNAAAKQIAAGDLNQRVNLQRQDALGELAKSFNRMAGQLQTSFTALETTNRDLEQRVQERTASLAAAEAELRGLFEAMTELIFVLDREGRYLKITAPYPELVYPSAEVLLGKTAHDVFTTDFADRVVRHVQNVLDQQQPLSVVYSLPLGDREAWFAANISPISTETVIWVARDISEQKQAEAALRSKNEELTQTLQQLRTTQDELVQSEKLAALGQLVAGIAHEINTPLGAIQASISNISGALEQSMQQLPQIFQLLPPERLADFFQLLQMTQQPKEPLSFREERQLRRSLKQFLETRAIPQADKVADILSKTGIGLENAEIDSLLALLQLPDHLFVLETAYQLSVVQKNSQNITLAVERAAKIVFALKNYARYDSSGKMVEALVIDGIDTVLTLYHNQLKQGIEVQKNYATIPQIPCYPEELTQVWSNLIHNALQAMNYHGTLAITVAEHNQHIVVQITDSGCGISPNIRDRIFEPFFTTKPIGEGSGLGLDIVRRIIAKHHGKVELESEPGHTTFSVWLPMMQAE